MTTMERPKIIKPFCAIRIIPLNEKTQSCIETYNVPEGIFIEKTNKIFTNFLQNPTEKKMKKKYQKYQKSKRYQKRQQIIIEKDANFVERPTIQSNTKASASIDNGHGYSKINKDLINNINVLIPEKTLVKYKVIENYTHSDTNMREGIFVKKNIKGNITFRAKNSDYIWYANPTNISELWIKYI